MNKSISQITWRKKERKREGEKKEKEREGREDEEENKAYFNKDKTKFWMQEAGSFKGSSLFLEMI